MRAVEIIAKLRELGFTVDVDQDGDLDLYGPKHELTERRMAALRQNKAAIINALRLEALRNAQVSPEVDPYSLPADVDEVPEKQPANRGIRGVILGSENVLGTEPEDDPASVSAIIQAALGRSGRGEGSLLANIATRVGRPRPLSSSSGKNPSKPLCAVCSSVLDNDVVWFCFTDDALPAATLAAGRHQGRVVYSREELAYIGKEWQAERMDAALLNLIHAAKRDIGGVIVTDVEEAG